MKTVLRAMFTGMLGCALIQPTSAVDRVTFKEKVLYSFCCQDYCPNGAYSEAGVIAVNGLLYGTNPAGGRGHKGCESAGCGTDFSFDPGTGGAEKVLHYFCSRHKCADGANPNALIAVNGTVYGTTVGGGRGFMGQRYGTAFTLDPSTGEEKVLHSFCQQQNCTDGGDPSAGLLYAKGRLYGVTVNGGATFFGTAFALDPKTGAVTVLYSFCSLQNCTDGRNPTSPLSEMNGVLYGTTTGGGAYCNGSCGAAFTINPDTGAEEVIHSFGNGADGVDPNSLIAANGMLYGTTYGGGTGGGTKGCGVYGCGTVFSIDPSTGAETVVYSFCSQQNCADGSHPFAGLIDVKGLLYGTTGSGGNTKCGYGCGTVFSIDPNTGVETILYAFQGGTDGATPAANLREVQGTLYGTTDLGGGSGCYGYGCGTVFALSKR